MKKATEAGLNQKQAAAFAASNVDTADSEIQTALDAAFKAAVAEAKGGVYAEGFDEQKNQVSQSSESREVLTPSGKTTTWQTTTVSSVQKAYNQDYSVVVGNGTVTKTNDSYNGTQTDTTFAVSKVAGYATPDKAVPTTGSAEYQGKAFSKEGSGDLNYTVNFDKRTGSGRITDIAETGRIDLAEGKLGKVGIGGKTVTGVSAAASAENGSKGTYRLGLFGKAAEEIAGSAKLPESEIGFGGKRGDFISREETERLEKRKAELNKNATEGGLTATQAKDYAEKYLKQDDAAAQAALKELVTEKAYQDGLAAAKEEKAKLDIYPAVDVNSYAVDAKQRHFVNQDFTNVNDDGEVTRFNGSSYIYQQPFSVVLSQFVQEDIRNNQDLSPEHQRSSSYIAGFATPENALPTIGTAVYKGLALKAPWEGVFTYKVNFDKRTGSGSIAGIEDAKMISLAEGNIGKVNMQGKEIIGINGTADVTSKSTLYKLTNGSYTLGFFGSAAQEVAGTVRFDHSVKSGLTQDGKFEIGFGGQRGEIKK